MKSLEGETKMKKLNKKGFTLIELIVVIAILAVLALLLVPQITGYIQASKDSVGKANAKSCYSALAVEMANDEANLGIVIEKDANCSAVKDGEKLTGAIWKDAEGKEYKYEGGVFVTPAP